MKALFILALLVVGGWHFWGQAAYEQYRAKSSVSATKQEQTMPALANRFKCDGRTRCSQMTSCEEATFFLHNCPNTKMDGDGDGVPCEKQWCRR